MDDLKRNERGFTLIEFGIIVVIVSMLAVFAVPEFLNSVERSKAAEALDYLSKVEAAQAIYHEREGVYAAKLSDLDVYLPVLKHFSTTGIAKSDPFKLQTSWRMTLTRSGDSAGFGAYTVVFNQNGFVENASTIRPSVNPLNADE